MNCRSWGTSIRSPKPIPISLRAVVSPAFDQAAMATSFDRPVRGVHGVDHARFRDRRNPTSAGGSVVLGGMEPWDCRSGSVAPRIPPVWAKKLRRDRLLARAADNCDSVS